MKNAPKLPNLENSEGARAPLAPLLIQALYNDSMVMIVVDVITPSCTLKV